MNLVFSSTAWDDYLYWQLNDKKLLKRINLLIKDMSPNGLIPCGKREPFKGLGEPEPLKYNWNGYYSRRINLEHRLVYKITDKSLLIAQCRYHY